MMKIQSKSSSKPRNKKLSRAEKMKWMSNMECDVDKLKQDANRRKQEHDDLKDHTSKAHAETQANVNKHTSKKLAEHNENMSNRLDNVTSSQTKMEWRLCEIQRQNGMLVDLIRSSNMTPKKLPFDVDEVTVATAASSVPSIHRREPNGMGGWKD